MFVEKGMDEGQVVKFRGDADQEVDKDPGDVVIVLLAKDHDRFTRKGKGNFGDASWCLIILKSN